MAYKIDGEKCTSCGNCESVCPNESISKADDRYVIDPEQCISCGLCEDECEAKAISEE